MAMVMGTATKTTGEDNDDNGQGWRQQWARMLAVARTTTARMTATTARTIGKDGEDNRQRQQQCQRQ